MDVCCEDADKAARSSHVAAVPLACKNTFLTRKREVGKYKEEEEEEEDEENALGSSWS